jgi:hypothetical protein
MGSRRDPRGLCPNQVQVEFMPEIKNDRVQSFSILPNNQVLQVLPGSFGKTGLSVDKLWTKYQKGPARRNFLLNSMS